MQQSVNEIKLEPRDFFRFFRNLQKSGILDAPVLNNRTSFEYIPGRRYFENIKEWMLTLDMEILAEKVTVVSPIIKKLSEERNWKQVELESKDFFRAFRNLQRSGVIHIVASLIPEYEYEPGRRYFENIKEFLNNCDMQVLARDVQGISPMIKLMADEKNWQMSQNV